MTDKQEIFCTEYLKDFNATKAAERAGYSPKTAYSIGHENLKKPEIQNKITKAKTEIVNKNRISIDSLMVDVANIKDKCINEKFDASNALKACELLSKFLIQEELKRKNFLSSLSDQELESIARELLRVE
jgi:phage terminase small subunit